MANPEASATPPAAAPTVKMPILPLLLCVVAAVVLAVGGSAGVMYMLVKSGRLPAVGAASAAPAKAEAVVVPTESLAMEPLLANLADADGHAYLRLGVVLQVEVPEKKGKEKEKEKEVKGAVNPAVAGLRDSVLEVLGRQQSAELLGADGKEHLKHELSEKFAKQNTETKVKEIYFTDFLVQR